MKDINIFKLFCFSILFSFAVVGPCVLQTHPDDVKAMIESYVGFFGIVIWAVVDGWFE